MSGNTVVSWDVGSQDPASLPLRASPYKGEDSVVPSGGGLSTRARGLSDSSMLPRRPRCYPGEHPLRIHRVTTRKEAVPDYFWQE